MIFLLMVGPITRSQPIQDYIKQALKAADQASLSPYIEEFYRVNEYKLVWIGHKNRIDQLTHELQTAPDYGLNTEDYQPEVLIPYRAPSFRFRSLNDSIGFDLQLSKAAVRFFCDVKNGGKHPELRYNGLPYEPDCSQIPLMVKMHMERNSLQDLAPSLTPNTREYNEVRKKLAYFNKIIGDSSFREVTITSGKVSLENKPLLLKLYQLGMLDSLYEPLTLARLKVSLKAAQKMLDVSSDGILGKASLSVLNVPLATRRNELKLLLNYLRWLTPYFNHPASGLLNIPSASLLVYQRGHVALESRVIVGKPSTPTPTLSSRITEVILYPYWMVPKSIAVKELLPKIQRNSGFLAANKYQVLNRQGKV
ncbi:MAG TPA: L,D-transpeptidase family protein, partial [Chitinophagaceae bacterium]